MNSIKEAAESLLAKNEITQEEFDRLEKTAAWSAKNVFETAKNVGKTLLDIHPYPTTAPGVELGRNVLNATKRIGTLGLPIAATAAAGLAAKELFYDPMKEKSEMNKSFKQLIEKTPALEGEDSEKIRDYFDVVKSFAPHAAANPLVAGALVNKMIQFGGVDHKLVQDMTSIQQGHAQEGMIPLIMAGAAKALTGTPKD